MRVGDPPAAIEAPPAVAGKREAEEREAGEIEEP